MHVNVVADFGADNAGGADAAAAIQAAIDSLAAGVVYFPPGLYALATGLVLKPNVMLLADDPLLATLVARSDNLKLVQFAAPALATGFTIRRLGFSGGGHAAVTGVSLDGGDAGRRISLVTLEDLYIALCERAVELRFCASTRVEGVRANACTMGVQIDQCADTEIDGGWAQNGGDFGLLIKGGPGAFDEGLRVAGFSTNGQMKGVGVFGQDWGNLTGCSFTTCLAGPATFSNSSNWKISDCDFATGGGAPSTPGFTADAGCGGLQLSNNLCCINTTGFNLLGSDHVVTGNRFLANTDVDINLEASRCVVTANHCASTGVATSIIQRGGADHNQISGNVVNGTVTLVGVNSVLNGGNVAY